MALVTGVHVRDNITTFIFFERLKIIGPGRKLGNFLILDLHFLTNLLIFDLHFLTHFPKFLNFRLAILDIFS